MSQIENLKAQAKRLAKHLQGSHNFTLSHSNSLHAIAAIHGIANWQTLLAKERVGEPLGSDPKDHFVWTNELVQQYHQNEVGYGQIVAWKQSDHTLYLAIKDEESVRCLILIDGVEKQYSADEGTYAADCGRDFLKHLTPWDPNEDPNSCLGEWFLYVQAVEDFRPLLHGLLKTYPLKTQFLIEKIGGGWDEPIQAKSIEENGFRMLEENHGAVRPDCEICKYIASGVRITITPPNNPSISLNIDRQPYIPKSES